MGQSYSNLTPAQVAKLLFSQSETSRAVELFILAKSSHHDVDLISVELDKLIEQHKAQNAEPLYADLFDAKVNGPRSVREIFSHRVNGLNEEIRLFATSTPALGGSVASEYILLFPTQSYAIGIDWIKWSYKMTDGTTLNLYPARHVATLLATHGNQAILETQCYSYVEIPFQVGTIKSVGINGVSNEALLAILMDRLEGFQKGQFPCPENAQALTKLEEAGLWLHKRTMNRTTRGVEGKLAP